MTDGPRTTDQFIISFPRNIIGDKEIEQILRLAQEASEKRSYASEEYWPVVRVRIRHGKMTITSTNLHTDELDTLRNQIKALLPEIPDDSQQS
jgi:hypothetical protein